MGDIFYQTTEISFHFMQFGIHFFITIFAWALYTQSSEIFHFIFHYRNIHTFYGMESVHQSRRNHEPGLLDSFAMLWIKMGNVSTKMHRFWYYMHSPNMVYSMPTMISWLVFITRGFLRWNWAYGYWNWNIENKIEFNSMMSHCFNSKWIYYTSDESRMMKIIWTNSQFYHLTLRKRQLLCIVDND